VSTEFGLLLPSRETLLWGDADAGLLLDAARFAEEAGFDAVWVGDSLLARPASNRSPSWPPWPRSRTGFGWARRCCCRCCVTRSIWPSRSPVSIASREAASCWGSDRAQNCPGPTPSSPPSGSRATSGSAI
jgi:hypothetical protein